MHGWQLITNRCRRGDDADEEVRALVTWQLNQSPQTAIVDAITVNWSDHLPISCRNQYDPNNTIPHVGVTVLPHAVVTYPAHFSHPQPYPRTTMDTTSTSAATTPPCNPPRFGGIFNWGVVGGPAAVGLSMTQQSSERMWRLGVRYIHND